MFGISAVKISPVESFLIAVRRCGRDSLPAAASGYGQKYKRKEALPMIRIFIIATLTGLALAQTPVPAGENVRSETARMESGTAKSDAAASATVAPGDNVLTIHGICALEGNPLSASAQDCTVVVQRQQFDTLLRGSGRAGHASRQAQPREDLRHLVGVGDGGREDRPREFHSIPGIHGMVASANAGGFVPPQS